MKIVIDVGWMGFMLSDAVAKELGVDRWDAERTDPALISWVERVMPDEMKVAEIPDGSYYQILACDGREMLIYSATPLKTVSQDMESFVTHY